MYKKVLLLTLGFGLITLGVTGITMSLVGRETEGNLRQLETARQEKSAAALEEQKSLDEKRQGIEKLSGDVAAEKKRLEDDRRAMEKDRRVLEETCRTRLAALEIQKKAAEAKAASSKSAVTGKGEKGGKDRTALSRKDREHEKGSLSGGRHQVRHAAAAKSPVRDEAFSRITRKAGFEAARSFQPVQYRNRGTGELILAEPFDFGPDSVMVRVRVWTGRRLVEDTVMSFSDGHLRGAGMPHA